MLYSQTSGYDNSLKDYQIWHLYWDISQDNKYIVNIWELILSGADNWYNPKI